MTANKPHDGKNLIALTDGTIIHAGFSGWRSTSGIVESTTYGEVEMADGSTHYEIFPREFTDVDEYDDIPTERFDNTRD